MTDLQGVFQLFLYSACQPRMTRVLIFPIFMDTPEYGEIPYYLVKFGISVQGSNLHTMRTRP